MPLRRAGLPWNAHLAAVGALARRASTAACAAGRCRLAPGRTRLTHLARQGCRELLVLLGPSYLSRLWCCIELYTFLRMGGSIDRIVVRSVGLSEDNIKQNVLTFDAAQCQCFKEDERQRLLAVIEAGFGNCKGFNELVGASLSAAIGRGDKAFATSAPLQLTDAAARVATEAAAAAAAAFTHFTPRKIAPTD